MVSAMASRDTEARRVAEGASLRGRPCWRRLYEQARGRAEAAEARSEALKRAEVSARCEAGYWKWQFESSRRKRLAAVARSKEARRAARDALALRAEVARLGKLLADAGVASGRYSETSLRREVSRLRKAAPGAEVQAAEIRRLHKVLWKERVDKAALRRLLHETVRLWDGTRKLRDQHDRVVSLSDDVGQLRYALQRSEAAAGRLKVRLLRRAESARAMSPAAADVALRKALGRSRRRKAALVRLRQENARLRRTVQASRRRIETQETELAKLRATRAVLSKALRGRRSEKRERPRTGRPRGQRRGAPGHGRTRNRSVVPVFCTGNAIRYSLWSRPWRVGTRKPDGLPKGLRCAGGRAGGGCMSRREVVPRRRKRGRKR